jgi:hypothetical protein
VVRPLDNNARVLHSAKHFTGLEPEVSGGALID